MRPIEKVAGDGAIRVDNHLFPVTVVPEPQERFAYRRQFPRVVRVDLSPQEEVTVRAHVYRSPHFLHNHPDVFVQPIFLCRVQPLHADCLSVWTTSRGWPLTRHSADSQFG